MEATFGEIFIVAEREVVWTGDLTMSYLKRIKIFSSFEVQTIGKAASIFGKENMISRA